MMHACVQGLMSPPELALALMLVLVFVLSLLAFALALTPLQRKVSREPVVSLLLVLLNVKLNPKNGTSEEIYTFCCDVLMVLVLMRIRYGVYGVWDHSADSSSYQSVSTDAGSACSHTDILIDLCL
jgi:hypothetical protein